MNTLYIECNMGAAGDMLTAALLELQEDPAKELAVLNDMGLEGVKISTSQVMRCGITGTKMQVCVDGIEEHELLEQDAQNAHQHHEHAHEHTHEHEVQSAEKHHGHEHAHAHHHTHTHQHASMQDIIETIQGLQLPQEVKEQAISVYQTIAEAESHAHAKPVTEIHFHEVGTKDAIADIVSVCYLMHRLQVGQVIVSPIAVGSGHVHCAHGILPVPAPATAYILQGIPIYQGGIQAELCTPTGAALLKTFATSFGQMPVMCTRKIGYGMGHKEFAQANCVRAFLGETKETTEEIFELRFNIDDMTGEEVGFMAERLREAGALDVSVASIQMKKNRPGILVICLCKKEDKEQLVRLIFQHSTTLGIRANSCERFTLKRREEIKRTVYGDIPVKISEGYGTRREKLEYANLEELARQKQCSILEIKETISK